MRYKFRAWSHGIKSETASQRRSFGEWVYPPQMLYDEKPGDCLVWKSQGQNIEVMQCTGLQDKNGKEIYEGDILHFADGLRPQFVKWSDWMAGFVMVLSETSGSAGIPSYCEVLGNIYSHPHLLEEQ